MIEIEEVKERVILVAVCTRDEAFTAHSLDELEDLADQIFYDMWRSLKYIKPSTKPYSYVYLAGMTSVSTFYSKKIRERQKVKAIEEHITDVYREYMAETADPKTPIRHIDI